MMQLNVHFDSKDVEKMLKEMRPAIKHAVQKFLTEAGLIVKADAKLNAPVDTGLLRSGIKSRTDLIQDAVVVAPEAEYGAYVEFGTRPHFPPVKALEQWAKTHTGSAKNAFLIAKGISKKGTKAQPYMTPALEDNADRILDLFVREINMAIERS